jgi:predicted alpha/beta-fold hydrolase
MSFSESGRSHYFLQYEPLEPHFLLKNAHLMTLAGAFWPRPREFSKVRKHFVEQEFQIADDVRLRAHCLLQKDESAAATLLVVHGLEGSSSSPDIMNLAAKAYLAKMNVVCINLRNCGDTLHLCPNLYNGGMSDDLLKVVGQLRNRGHRDIYAVGYSLGGNIVLKLGGELSKEGPEWIKGICAISPAVNLHECVKAIERGMNRIYELRFLHSLKQKIRLKDALYPGKYPVSQLSTIRTLQDFDNVFTAPDGGYKNAIHYYESCSSISLLKEISVPTLMIVSRDDPMVPFEIFSSEHMQNPFIHLLATEFGGHGGFLTQKQGPNDPDCFWAENRIIQFCRIIHDGKTASATATG